MDDGIVAVSENDGTVRFSPPRATGRTKPYGEDPGAFFGMILKPFLSALLSDRQIVCGGGPAFA
jgi:hypothetical protein